MEVLYDGLEAFKRSLPPSLAGHWIEILVSLVVFSVLLFLSELVAMEQLVYLNI